MPEDDDPSPAPPINRDQLAVILDSIRMVIDSPDGCGAVEITISGGHVRFIRPTVSLDLGRVERVKDYLRTNP